MEEAAELFVYEAKVADEPVEVQGSVQAKD
jgi:hypothetical protein